MIDVILQIMNAFLFDEFMLWIWGPWSLLAILNGYLIADGFDSVEEAGLFWDHRAHRWGLSLFTREFFWKVLLGGSKVRSWALSSFPLCRASIATGGVADWNRGGAWWLGAVAVTAFVVLSLGLSFYSCGFSPFET